MPYVAQLLPDSTQARIIIQALKDYSNKHENNNPDEAFRADEIRLKLLTDMRKNGHL